LDVDPRRRRDPSRFPRKLVRLSHGRTKATASQAGPCVFFVACDAALLHPHRTRRSALRRTTRHRQRGANRPAPPREGSRQSYLLPLALYASDGTRTRDIRRDKAGVLVLGRGAHADPLSAGKGSRSRQPGQQKLPLSGGFPGQLVDQPLSQTCRKTTRDVAVRRAYRRCVRNVSACSADRQQQSADLQALY